MTRVVAAILIVGCCATTSVDAQTSAEVRQRIRVLGDSLKATQARLQAARDRKTLALDDVLVSEGVTVRFPGEAMSERNRNALREGISAARNALEERFGAGSARLLDGSEWLVLFNGVSRNRREFVGFVEGRNPTAQLNRLVSLPLAPSDVERFVLEIAGRKLLQPESVVGTFAGRAFFLTPQDEAFYVARRQLAVSTSSVARRCAKGALGACRTILDPAASADWFATSDTVPRDGRPIPRGVNASLVTVALDLGGARAIDVLSKPNESDNPLTILADAAGVTPDSLLQTWTARLQDATMQSAHPSLPLAASAVFWCGIFLMAATRRRPR
jgi:hypothetical protein